MESGTGSFQLLLPTFRINMSDMGIARKSKHYKIGFKSQWVSFLTEKMDNSKYK